MRNMYSKCSKISNSFHFLHVSSNKLLVIRAGNHKMLVRIDSKDLNQTSSKKQSDLDLCCVYRPFRQASSVHNFSTATVHDLSSGYHF